MNTSTKPCLGVDFGRVIHGGPLAPGTADTAFLSGSIDEALASPATGGVYEVLPRLVQRFEGRVWIISKCGRRIEARTRQWLRHHDFSSRTGIPAENLRFCRKRADKATHCADLGITHMVDDRLDVHLAVRELVPHRYLFGPQDAPAPAWVRHARTWDEVETAIGEDTPLLSAGKRQ